MLYFSCSFFISLCLNLCFICLYTYYTVCYSFMFNLYLHHCFHLYFITEWMNEFISNTFYFITFIIVTLIILAKVLYLAFNAMPSGSTSINQIRNIAMLGMKVEYWSEWEQRKIRLKKIKNFVWNHFSFSNPQSSLWHTRPALGTIWQQKS